MCSIESTCGGVVKNNDLFIHFMKFPAILVQVYILTPNSENNLTGVYIMETFCVVVFGGGICDDMYILLASGDAYSLSLSQFIHFANLNWNNLPVIPFTGCSLHVCLY